MLISLFLLTKQFNREEYRGVPLSSIKTFAYNEPNEMIILNDTEGLTQDDFLKYKDITRLIYISNDTKVIPARAFSDFSRLKTLEFENGDQSIEIQREAFKNSSIESLSLHPRVKVFGISAFERCLQLKVAYIPEFLTVIPENAFLDCTNLRSFHSYSRLFEKIGKNAFRNTSIDRLDISVYEVGEYAFAYTRMESVTLRKVRYYSNYLFYNSTLAFIYECENVEWIGDYAFAYCHHFHIYDNNKFNKLTRIGHYAFYNSNLFDFYAEEAKDLTFIGDHCFEHTLLRFFFTPPISKLESIGSYAFSSSEILNFSIPNTVKYLGEGIFADCIFLSNVTFSNDTITIPKKMFYKCVVLSLINKPIREIGEYSLAYSGVSSIRLTKEVTFLPEGVFAYSGLNNFTSEGKLEKISKYAFASCVIINNFNISVQNIEEYAFVDTIFGSQNITFNGINNIGYKSFYNSGINNIYLINQQEKINTIKNIKENNHLNIEKNAFEGSIIEKMYIKGLEITKIEDYVFKNSKLKYIKIPESVENIGIETFYGTELERVIIPENVKTIGEKAFSSCSKLNKTTYLGDTEIKNKIFEGSNNLSFVYVKYGYMYKYVGELPTNFTYVEENPNISINPDTDPDTDPETEDNLYDPNSGSKDVRKITNFGIIIAAILGAIILILIIAVAIYIYIKYREREIIDEWNESDVYYDEPMLTEVM